MKALPKDSYPILGLLLIQIIFWLGFSFPLAGTTLEWMGSRALKPDLYIVPPVPSEQEIKALSLGDEQFYFRSLAFTIQNAGDTFGRSTPLKNYDYKKLLQWWQLLDNLDARSNLVPSLVSYYYSNSQEPKRDVPYVVTYLEQHADRDPSTKWWWYSQAIYNAKHRLEDKQWALNIAKKLSAIPKEVKMPFWARQMEAFLHEDLGEYEEALVIIKSILDNYEDIPPGEINFMNYFINERLEAIKNKMENENGDRPWLESSGE